MRFLLEDGRVAVLHQKYTERQQEEYDPHTVVLITEDGQLLSFGYGNLPQEVKE